MLKKFKTLFLFLKYRPAETDLDGELLEPNEEQKLQEDGTGEEEEQLDDVGEETQESGDLDESEQALLKSEDKEEGGLDTTGQDNLDETLENKENKEGVTMPVKKEVKRKAREKRYDENLILEEDDEEVNTEFIFVIIKEFIFVE